jgi:hypothetical protein
MTARFGRVSATCPPATRARAVLVGVAIAVLVVVLAACGSAGTPPPPSASLNVGPTGSAGPVGSAEPSASPSAEPSASPSAAPTATPAPSSSPTTTPVPSPSLASPVTGVVIAVDSAGLSQVKGFTLRLSDGSEQAFVLGTLENGTEFPPGHLKEHAVSAAPVRVFFRAEGGDLVVYRIEDAG